MHTSYAYRLCVLVWRAWYDVIRRMSLQPVRRRLVYRRIAYDHRDRHAVVYGRYWRRYRYIAPTALAGVVTRAVRQDMYWLYSTSRTYTLHPRQHVSVVVMVVMVVMV